VEGLPERPPSDELILWQGKPQVLALARDALNLYWVAGYFVLLGIWRAGSPAADMPLSQALPLGVPFLVMGALACMILYGIAWVLAGTTVYTITTARVVMRVGAALTVTLNLPFSRVMSADLSTHRDGTGTIVFATPKDVRLSFLVLWPHTRPWTFRHTQPAMRSIPDAENVAKILLDAAETRIDRPEIEVRGFDTPMPAQ
jgi:hypothetical protein